MWRFITAGLVIVVIVVFGFSLIDVGGGEVGGSAVVAPVEDDTSQYAQAIEARDWQFPRDHGAHPEFQTEWWYYTGNLATEDGRRFGYQFTVFRRAIAPQVVSTGSEWRTGQIYMAHFTVSDLAGEAFYHDERYSRGGAGLAGALPDPAQPDADYRVWLEDWETRAINDEHTLYTIKADMGEVAVDFTLEQAKPPAFQGDNGLSPKSEETGNASYYYSLSRLLTDGTLTINGETFSVSGTSWMDHEFSTSALGPDALGWDWFGLHFDDGRDLMVGRIRLTDGGKEPAFGGLLIDVDGSTTYLDSSAFVIEDSGDTWTSPHTGATYPAGWTVTINADAINADSDLIFTATPMMADQELHSGDIAYWEGAVRLEGDISGYGYAELTGYVQEMTGRF